MIQIKVNTVDKSSLIAWDSVVKQEVLTKEPDTLQFIIRNYPTKTYIPALGDTVQMYDGATIIFGGTVISIQNDIKGLLTETTVYCRDWMGLADGKMVAKSYTAQTATAIVTDIFSTYTSGFTVVNVNAPVTIDKITFNYISVVQALKNLIQVLGGGFDFYIDYSKDVHFFQTGAVLAPFSLSDTSANFDYQSLTLTTDITQLRNQVIVRGGFESGTSVTNSQIADGTQIVFFVGYNLVSFTASKALAASPTVFNALTVGADGKDAAASYDCLYNPDYGLLKFPVGTTLAINDVLKYTGTPRFPVISEVQNDPSIALYGTRQSVIVDTTLTSRAAARGKAQAEIYQYGLPLVNGHFRTRTSGLIAGQIISIACTLRGISGSYKIERIQTTFRTPSASTTDFFFDVDFVSTVGINLIDILNRLLIVDPSTQVSIGSNEIIDLVGAYNETVTASEVTASSLTHTAESETVTAGESFTNNGLNFGTIFVAGAQVPSSTKRQFVLNGSYVG